TYLRQEGIDLFTGVAIQKISGAEGAICIDAEIAKERSVVCAEQLLVATGRRPNTVGLGLEEIGVRLGSKGEVLVDAHLETTRPGIYAAGDVTGGPAFVYVAAYAGNLAAENAIEQSARTYDVSVLPRVTFTDPAIASIGLTELEARERGIAVKTAKLPLA